MKIVKKNYFYIASLSSIDVFPSKEKCLKLYNLLK